MYDINFFKTSNNLKNKITQNKIKKDSYEDIIAELDVYRDKNPFIYNIETTNYCNMKCVMCPRTQFMTRKNIWIDDILFDKMTDKVKIHDLVTNLFSEKVCGINNNHIKCLKIAFFI